MGIVLFTNTGYTSDKDGYSVSFSWWRNKDKFGTWWVCGHEIGFSKLMTPAVTDDFGNLVAVKS